ncbi:hypothetical protein B0H63DRAFT_442297 [Podospora didyma]|uniref:Uncharacterized protein n=1 Tax=Podospora didyma TaxID=330526 RepID=A0AAE0K0E4_9PEZI|nr:hypothetical protein B0H63DRAFT_442297 [Podospora didyma]
MAARKPLAGVLTLLVLLLTLAHQANATFWTVTSYSAAYLSTSGTRVYTRTTDVASGVKPTATPYSTSSYVMTYSDVTIVYVYLPIGAVADKDIVTTTTYSPPDYGAYTAWAIPVVWTAPPACATPFTVSTYTNFYPPAYVTDILSPISTATSMYTNAGGSKITYYTKFIDASAQPSSINPTSNYYYSNYVLACSNPTATPTYSRYSGGSGSGSPGSGVTDALNNYAICGNYYGCWTALAVWIIAIAVIIPSLFFLGFLESWFWFRALMLGKQSLRFGTICWCCLTLWVICFTRVSPARTPQDKAILKQRWAAIPAGRRIKLWFKWGFRHQYPVDLLGPDPRGKTPGGVPLVAGQQQQPFPPNGGTRVNNPQTQQQPYYSPQQQLYPTFQQQQPPPPPQQQHQQQQQSLYPGPGGYGPPQGYQSPPLQQGGYPSPPPQGFPASPPAAYTGQFVPHQQQQQQQHQASPSSDTASTQHQSMHSPSPAQLHGSSPPPPRQ